jgi:hypothetical protein
MDADDVRKLILKPGRLVDEPNFDLFNKIYEECQHLKGEKRSNWMRGILKQMVFYYKDQTNPWSDSLPQMMRKCRAQEINDKIVGYTNTKIEAIARGLTPPLSNEDKELLLKEVVGSQSKRDVTEALKTVGSIFGNAILGGINGFFGGKGGKR